ncbi:Uncharacterised protein [Neisseria meningitidis]|nr:Uncharacterised protein [Neisseria meningitidis]CKL58481.1 Uncharacterised protein [Neisseria meningitidis]
MPLRRTKYPSNKRRAVLGRHIFSGTNGRRMPAPNRRCCLVRSVCRSAGRDAGRRMKTVRAGRPSDGIGFETAKRRRRQGLPARKRRSGRRCSPESAAARPSAAAAAGWRAWTRVARTKRQGRVLPYAKPVRESGWAGSSVQTAPARCRRRHRRAKTGFQTAGTGGKAAGRLSRRQTAAAAGTGF